VRDRGSDRQPGLFRLPRRGALGPGAHRRLDHAEQGLARRAIARLQRHAGHDRHVEVGERPGVGIRRDIAFLDALLDSRPEVRLALVALPGERVDARTLIPQAIAAGAAAVIWEARGFQWNSDWRLPNLPVAENYRVSIWDYTWFQAPGSPIP